VARLSSRRRVTHRRVTTKRKKKISAAASRNSPAALAGKSPFAQASEPLVVDPPAPAAAEITAALTSPSVAAALLGSGPKAVGFPKLLSPLNPATQEVAAETSARDSWGLGGPADVSTSSSRYPTPPTSRSSAGQQRRLRSRRPPWLIHLLRLLPLPLRKRLLHRLMRLLRRLVVRWCLHGHEK
jgi:hypothetical protein